MESTKNQFKIYQEGESPTYLRFDETTNTWSIVDQSGESQELISFHQDEAGESYLVYKDNSVVSLDPEADYTYSMLNYVFAETVKEEETAFQYL